MLSPSARLISVALAVLLLAQQIPVLAFQQDSGDQACCCKDKAASCCRRSHHLSGPGLSSRESCCGCVIWIRHSQPVAAIALHVGPVAGLVPVVASVVAATWISFEQSDAVLFERPPPYSLL